MKKRYLYTLTTLLIWAVAGCKKPSDFGNANVDPSATTTPIVSALLANVEQGLPGYASTNTEPIYGAQYAQYFSETQYPSSSLYVLPSVNFVPTYSGSLYDLQNVINLNQSKNSVAVAKIMQQYIYWVLTDSFGDLPYSQALLGIKSITPVYDKQEDIYKGILATLTSAVASMDAAPIAGDLFYGGDPAGWKRAANSLRMLVAIQLSAKVPGTSDYAATAFKAAQSDPAGYITTNAQNFALTYPGGTFKDPYYNLYNGRTDYGESKTMTDITGSLGDGRTVVFGGAFTDPGQTTGGTQTSAVGVPYGLDRGGVTAFTGANPGYALVLRADKRTDKGTVVIISAAETVLAIAEAINIGWTTGDLNGTYQSGINLSFEQWGLADPSANYFTQSGVALGAPDGNSVATTYATANAKNIAIQQWLAAYPDGHMGWNIWRKTGWPKLTPAPGAQNSSRQIVRRFVYTPSEYTTNTVNVKAAVAREPGGVDSQDNPVFWDIKITH
ncbi:MAG: hypothetical protein JWR02_1118 [Mucilaginibacter sp.]|nr:hypothetical protein [Mucilaginibacter sp.]